MARWLTAAAVGAVFLVLAAANSGGYRYGVSDQAFYIPAIESAIDPSLFPRDHALLDAQAKPWLLDDVIGAVWGGRPVNMPVLIGVLYVIGTLTFAAGAVWCVRALGGSPAAVFIALALLTLRHRIARTIPTSMEGYFHPRVMAFGLGLVAIGFLIRRRMGFAALLVALSCIVHTPTGIWFGVMVLIAWVWSIAKVRPLTFLGAAGVAVVILASGLMIFASRMDPEWLSVISTRDYMFPAEWPFYAWLSNMAYLPIILLVYRHRAGRGVVLPGERGLVIGAGVFLKGFLVSVPLSSAGVTLALQAQVSRGFWVLDALATIYVAVWLADQATRRANVRWAFATAALIAAVSAARGWYVLTYDVERPLIEMSLPAGEWADAMLWLRHQPVSLNVLADPGHAVKYGSSVRVGAARDTVIEMVKDAAMAMYDRPAALRVADRAHALYGFEEIPEDRLRDLAARYEADVVLVENTRRLSWPVRYTNPRFTIYQAR